MYKKIWEPELSEILECVRETNNTTDRYAVAVKKKAEIIVSHIPTKISRFCSFLKCQRSYRNTAALLTPSPRRSGDSMFYRANGRDIFHQR